MTALDVLKSARAAGIHVHLDGDDLLLEAAAPPVPELLDLLSSHKAAIVALLRPGPDGWSAEDWRIFFDERGSIVELNAGLPRPEAEARGFAWCVAEWLNRNFMRSPPGRCLSCGGRDQPNDVLLPYGVEPTGHAWLHPRCWPAWNAARKAEAVAALAAMGIVPPSKFPSDFGKNGSP